jgi:hypothetical protein
MPSVPRAPGSVPPCAGSNTTTFKPVRLARGVDVLAVCCVEATLALPAAVGDFGAVCATFAAGLLFVPPCRGAAHPIAPPHNAAAPMPVARICRAVGKNLTPSRIPNLNALVDSKNLELR